MESTKILVVDDEPDIRQLLKEILEDEGYRVDTAGDAAEARQIQRQFAPELILLDIWMPDTDGISLLKEWHGQEQLQQTPVVMMSGHGSVETAVEATRHGAYDFIEKPLSLAKLLVTVRNALDHASLQRQNIDLRQQSPGLIEPVGHSALMRSLREQCQRIAGHDSPVLIHGGAGSGKRLFARLIHHLSPRGEAKFLCANLPAHDRTTLAELLFGRHDQPGLLERAGEGTLLLDDIADLDPESQERLLSALDGQRFRPVNGGQERPLLCRIIAATGQPLQQQIEEGTFRQDLYYRLSVFPLFIPPLHEHREDVPDLLGFYSEQIAERDKLPYRSFTTAAQNRLRQYDWPGNVTELINLVQRLLLLGSGDKVEIEEVEEALGSSRPLPGARAEAAPYQLPLRQAREQFERSYFERLLLEYQGSVTSVAQHAGVERTHLYRKLRALGLDPKQFSDARP